MKGWIAAAAIVLTPGLASAQAYSCAVPGRIERPHPDLPTADQPQRLLPIGSYTLAISWAPQYCREHARDASARAQCGNGNRFGFTLHGLWPDGVGRDWPQYCRAAPLLPASVIRANLCATPSAQLLQHEWAKHGTCMPGLRPADYFRRSTGLYSRLRYPDMDALSREPLTVGRFAEALAAANRGLQASMIRVTATKQGWLDEVWLCLDTRFAYERCRTGSGGLPADASLKIWRGPGLRR
jgi:ribonuclease T2